MGVIVQSRVRVLGSEIDLMLCKFDTLGNPEYTIIEIKYRESRATISQIMRLFGLKEALGNEVNIKHALIANVRGLTKPANGIIKKLDMHAIEIGELFEWIGTNKLNAGPKAFPFIKTLTYSSSRQVRLPKQVHQLLGRDVILAGQINKLELWKRDAWEEEIEKDFFERDLSL